MRVFDDGGVGAAALAAPHLLASAGVPVLVGGLSQLGPHLHQVVRVGVHQRLGGEQAQVCRGAGDEPIRAHSEFRGEWGGIGADEIG